MLLLSLLVLGQDSGTPPQKSPPPVQRTDAVRIPVPSDRPAGFTEVEAPADREGDPIKTGKPKNVWTFRRNNPRSTYMLTLAPKAGGRPALVDAAGKPVRRNLVFTVANPSLGPVKVYATRLARGSFFTVWRPLPKNSAGKFLQVTGILMSAAEIRTLVGGIRLLAATRAPGKTIGGDPYEKDAGEDKTDGNSTVNGGGKTGGR